LQASVFPARFFEKNTAAMAPFVQWNVERAKMPTSKAVRTVRKLLVRLFLLLFNLLRQSVEPFQVKGGAY